MFLSDSQIIKTYIQVWYSDIFINYIITKTKNIN